MFRHIFSRDRHRYQRHDYDLDLTYILPNIIAMGFPGSCNYHKAYTNDVEDVAQFLDETHGPHYYVYNLCSERSYPARCFHHRVTRYRIDDLNPPPIEMMRIFCEDVDNWLSLDPRNVVAVHCHAGKGRTGTMICAFMLYKRMFNTAEKAIEFFSSKRVLPGIKAMHPGQERYVRYFSRLIRERFVYNPKPLMLLAVEFSECPGVNGFLCSPYFKVKQRGVRSSHRSPVYKADSRRRLLMELPRPLLVAGDVKIEFYDRQGPGKMMLFWTWLNTYFVRSSPLTSLGGSSAGGPMSDEWRPVPRRTDARHDGSDPAMRCFVSVLGVGESGDMTGQGPVSGGRCITVSLPQPELDRIAQSTLNSIVKPDFMVKLFFSTLPGGA